MNSAKEKANDLCVSFLLGVVDENDVYEISKSMAKQCALICVDEILDILENKLDFKMIKSMTYWNEIKREIEKL